MFGLTSVAASAASLLKTSTATVPKLKILGQNYIKTGFIKFLDILKGPSTCTPAIEYSV
jgi:hypothetical protein